MRATSAAHDQAGGNPGPGDPQALADDQPERRGPVSRRARCGRRSRASAASRGTRWRRRGRRPRGPARAGRTTDTSDAVSRSAPSASCTWARSVRVANTATSPFTARSSRRAVSASSLRRPSRPHDQRHSPVGSLRERVIDHRRRRIRDGQVLHVSHDADDPQDRVAAVGHPLADRGAAEEPPRQRLIHDDDGLAAVRCPRTVNVRPSRSGMPSVSK